MKADVMFVWRRNGCGLEYPPYRADARAANALPNPFGASARAGSSATGTCWAFNHPLSLPHKIPISSSPPACPRWASPQSRRSSIQAYRAGGRISKIRNRNEDLLSSGTHCNFRILEIRPPGVDDDVRVRREGREEERLAAKPLSAPYDDPISCLRVAVLGGARPDGLSSLATNLIVTEILDAARQSAASGKTIRLRAAP